MSLLFWSGAGERRRTMAGRPGRILPSTVLGTRTLRTGLLASLLGTRTVDGLFWGRDTECRNKDANYSVGGHYY